MSEFDIIRAWKDPEYRKSLSQEALDQLPTNPAGMVELTEDVLQGVGGLEEPNTIPTITCPIITCFGTLCADSWPCGTCQIRSLGCAGDSC